MVYGKEIKLNTIHNHANTDKTTSGYRFRRKLYMLKHWSMPTYRNRTFYLISLILFNTWLMCNKSLICTYIQFEDFLAVIICRFFLYSIPIYIWAENGGLRLYIICIARIHQERCGPYKKKIIYHKRGTRQTDDFFLQTFHTQSVLIYKCVVQCRCRLWREYIKYARAAPPQHKTRV